MQGANLTPQESESLQNDRDIYFEENVEAPAI